MPGRNGRLEKNDNSLEMNHVKRINMPQISTSGNIEIVREIWCPVGSTTVNYTDDLKLLAIGQENGSVQLYESGIKTQLLYDCEMVQEGEPCTDIKIRASPKSGFHKNILVTYLGGHIKLWDTKIGKCLFTMKEKREIYGVNYHPKTSKFITYGNDFKLYLYDEERRVTERILSCSEIFGSKNGHTDSVCCAKFHPRNPFEIISSGLDNTIQFWDLRAPYAVRCILNVINFGEALDISNDGKTILAGVSNSRNGIIRTYDYDTGSKITENNFTNTYVYCCRYLTPVHVGVGGFLENCFRVIDLGTGKILCSVNGLPGCVISFASKQKFSQRKLSNIKIPGLVISSGEKVLELEMMSWTDPEPQ